MISPKDMSIQGENQVAKNWESVKSLRDNQETQEQSRHHGSMQGTANRSANINSVSASDGCLVQILCALDLDKNQLFRKWCYN